MGTPPCTPSAGPAPTRASTSTLTNLQTRQRLRTAPTPRNCPLPVTCIRPILWSRWPHQVPRPIISSTDGGPGSYRAVAAERPAARGVAPRGGASLGAVARQKTQCGTAGRSTLCVDLGAVSGARGRSLGEPSVAMMIPGMRRNGRGDPSRRPRREGTRQPAGRPAYNPTQQSTRDLSCSSTGTQVHGSRFEELTFTWLIHSFIHGSTLSPQVAILARIKAAATRPRDHVKTLPVLAGILFLVRDPILFIDTPRDMYL